MTLSDRLQSAAVQRAQRTRRTDDDETIVLDADGVIDLRAVESTPHPSGVTGVPEAIAAMKGRFEDVSVDDLYLPDEAPGDRGWRRKG